MMVHGGLGMRCRNIKCDLVLCSSPTDCPLHELHIQHAHCSHTHTVYFKLCQTFNILLGF